jgi:plasmid stabilization system protein ParE
VTRIVFRKEALADLEAITAWYEDVAPDALPRILEDVFRAIDQLAHYPQSGMIVPGRPFRRIVTRRYHFKIAYEIAGDLILILGIFRYQNRES